jgi:hypothetical protein
LVPGVDRNLIHGYATNEVNLVGGYYSPDLLASIERQNSAVGLRLDTKFDRDHLLNALFRCDHLAFLAAGVPAVWLFGGFHPGYHEPTDTVAKLNFPKMENVIRLAYLVAMEIANAPTGPRFSPASSRPLRGEGSSSQGFPNTSP